MLGDDMAVLRQQADETQLQTAAQIEHYRAEIEVLQGHIDETRATITELERRSEIDEAEKKDLRDRMSIDKLTYENERLSAELKGKEDNGTLSLTSAELKAECEVLRSALKQLQHETKRNDTESEIRLSSVSAENEALKAEIERQQRSLEEMTRSRLEVDRLAERMACGCVDS